MVKKKTTATQMHASSPSSPDAAATTRVISLGNLASGDAEIVALEIGAFDSRQLRPRNMQRETACDGYPFVPGR